ncbi:MAG: M14 family zinc carboxypeptidase [Pseudomonadota bacterium]
MALAISLPAFASHGHGAVKPAKMAKPAVAKSAAPATPPTTPAEWCKSLASRIPGTTQASCQGTSLQASGALSRNGFPILERHVVPPASALSKVGNKKAPLRVLLIGGIHGDELTASGIVFQWLQKMQTPAAQNFEWKVAPLINPDGLLAPKPRRVNAKGVDLNRNFPTPGWEKEAPRYWAKATHSDPRRFPGNAPLSEPESCWVSDAIEKFKPDVIISVHAPFGVLDFDGPATPPTRFGRLIYNRVGVYPGSLGNYSGLYKHVPVITIELPNSQLMPPEAEVQRIWLDMLSWMRRNVPQQAAAHAKAL